MRRINTWQDAITNGTAELDTGDGLTLKTPLDVVKEIASAKTAAITEATTTAATDATTKANNAKAEAIDDAPTKYGGLSGRVATLEKPVGRARVATTAAPATGTRTALGVRVPFRLPFDTAEYRVHFRNGNPYTGAGRAGAITFTATAVAAAQVFEGNLTAASGSTFAGSATLPDGVEYVTPWKTDLPLTAGTWYHLSYGITTAGTAFYGGSGQAWTNTAPTSVLNTSMSGAAIGDSVPLDVWIEAIPTNGTTPDVVFAGVAAPASGSTGGPTTSSHVTITAVGDSLTDGGVNGLLWPEMDTWAVKLADILPNTAVVNLGVSGATIDEELLLIGALPAEFIIPSGGIANGGNGTVTPARTYGMPPGSRTLDFIYQGMNGRLIKDAAGVWKLYNYGAAPVPAGKVTLDPKAGWGAHAGDAAIIWLGINDNTYGITGLEATVADHIVAAHQRFVAWLTPQVKQFMILGIHSRTTETTGTAGHATVLDVNRRLRELYPGNFKSIQDYLRGPALADLGVTPTQDDLDKIAAGTVTPSALAAGDQTHISKATAAVLPAKFFKPYLTGKGGVDA